MGCTPNIDPEIALIRACGSGGSVTLLLEREHELAEIDAVLAEVGAGNGRAVAIEAGAG